VAKLDATVDRPSSTTKPPIEPGEAFATLNVAVDRLRMKLEDVNLAFYDGRLVVDAGATPRARAIAADGTTVADITLAESLVTSLAYTPRSSMPFRPTCLP
jgi:hypothetical protein